MATIPSDPTLSQLQTYQAEVCRERGWDQTGNLETFLLFSEEVGEMAKAIRNRMQLYQEKGKATPPPQALESEFADVLSYLMELANRFEVDLSEAYRRKEALNQTRDWQ